LILDCPYLAQHTQRTARRIEAYYTEHDLAIAAIATGMASGEDPAVVSAVVLQTFTDVSPSSRFLAGHSTKAVNLSRRLLPTRLFNKGQHKQYGLA